MDSPGGSVHFASMESPVAVEEVIMSNAQYVTQAHTPTRPHATPILTQAALVAVFQNFREEIRNDIKSIKEELRTEVDEIKIELQAEVKPLKRRIDKLEKTIRTSVMTSLEVLHEIEHAHSQAQASSSRKSDSDSD